MGKSSRRAVGISLLSFAVMAAPVTALPVYAEAPVDISLVEGAQFVTDSEVVEAHQLEAALAAQARGLDTEPDEFSVVDVDGTTVTLPHGSVLNEVSEDDGHTFVDWEPSESTDVSEPLVSAEALSIVRRTGMYFRNGGCTTISNKTGEMETCYFRYRSQEKISYNSKSQYLNILAVEGVHKSKDAFRMNKARVRANPKQSDYLYFGMRPKTDVNYVDCATDPLALYNAGSGVTVNVLQCDKLEVGTSGKGQMDATWFGRAVRSKRAAALMVGVGRTSSDDATWALRSDFWAF